MKFRTHSFRHSEVILNEPSFIEQWLEVKNILTNIKDEDIIKEHQSYGETDKNHSPKSISKALNVLLKNRFHANGWLPESPIFQDSNYQGDTWRLDFAKKDISLEVAFNHTTVIAWNLTKPVLASELNHVNKKIQTQVGIIITATQELKTAGGFDGAIGTFEKFLDYLPPLRNMLTVPLMIIGLEAPETFKVTVSEFAERKKIGNIIRLPPLQ